MHSVVEHVDADRFSFLVHKFLCSDLVEDRLHRTLVVLAAESECDLDIEPLELACEKGKEIKIRQDEGRKMSLQVEAAGSSPVVCKFHDGVSWNERPWSVRSCDRW